MLIGAAYIRVSTDDQLDLSPDSQLDEIKKYAAANDIVLSPDYIFMEQEGRSGKKAENRPEFQRMISTAKVKPKPFDCILVWKFSRFARNQDESTFYKGMLRKKLGIDVISVSEPIMEGMYGRLIEMIIEWQDEFYSYNLGVEVKRGMTKKAELKGYQMVPCLGYAAVGNGKPFVIMEDEYKIVEDIFRMYALENLDRTAIARRLNAQGKTAKRGNPFEQRTVTRILTNPFYNGIVNWNGISFQGSHETRRSVTDLYDICQERAETGIPPREAPQHIHMQALALRTFEMLCLRGYDVLRWWRQKPSGCRLCLLEICQRPPQGILFCDRSQGRASRNPFPGKDSGNGKL